MSLSEKRKELIKHLVEIDLGKHLSYIFGLIEKQDREAIEELKKELVNETGDQFLTSREFNPNILLKIIDKIFGEFK